MPKNFALNVPAVDGVGAPADLTLGGTFNPGALKTLLLDQSTNNFVGQLFIDVSGDGVTFTLWYQVQPGSGEYTTAEDGVIFTWARVRRANTVNLGATPLPILNLVVSPEESSTGASGTAGIYGDGSDGNATFDGVSNFVGMFPTPGPPGSFYYTAVRDLFFNNLTVEDTIFLRMSGFRLFVAGVLTNKGSIVNNGSPGAAGGMGGAGGNNVSGSIGSAAIFGGNASAIGGAGAPGGASSPSVLVPPAGTGGTGGDGSVTLGGAGGAVVQAPAADGNAHSQPQSVLGAAIGNGVNAPVTGGSAGGAGGGDANGLVAVGGGGGGPGGALMVAAKTLLNEGTGVISADGGAGGDGAPGGGGGGGGSGGIVWINTALLTNLGAIRAFPGAGGLPGAGGFVGFGGSSGLVITLLS